MMNGVLTTDDLDPLIEKIVSQVVARLEKQRQELDGQRVFTEVEAASFLKLEPRQLADERRRGRIVASKIVGKRIRYLESDLISYVAGRREIYHE
jgi:hypothetical protein